MKGIEKITQLIQTEAQSEIDSVLANARQEADTVASRYQVRAEAEVTAVEGKVITFALRAFDEAGEIGKGTHKRVIVNSQKFLDKAYQKL